MATRRLVRQERKLPGWDRSLESYTLSGRREGVVAARRLVRQERKLPGWGRSLESYTLSVPFTNYCIW